MQKIGLKEITKHWKIVVIGLVAALIFLFIGTKGFLYLNFMVGNDIIVRLGVDNSTLRLFHGKNDSVLFEASVTTNPFCEALCTSTFMDKSRDVALDTNSFVLKQGTPFKKQYILAAPEYGQGMDIYRFDLECKNVRSFLCQTEEAPSTRSILLTVQYSLNSPELKEKKFLQNKLNSSVSRVFDLKSKETAHHDTISELDRAISTEFLSGMQRVLMGEINTDYRLLRELQPVWERQEYHLLADEYPRLESKINKTEILSTALSEELALVIIGYNTLCVDMNLTADKLENLTSTLLTNWTLALQIANGILTYNREVDTFNEKKSLEAKGLQVNAAVERVDRLAETVEDAIRREAAERLILSDISFDLICEFTDLCVEHPGIETRSTQALDLNASCLAAQLLHETYLEHKREMHPAFLNQSYPASEEFWLNISNIIASEQNRIIKKMLRRLPEGDNQEVFREILVQKPAAAPAGYPQYDLSPALLSAMSDFLPTKCDFVSMHYDWVRRIRSSLITMTRPVEIVADILFTEQEPLCPVLGMDTKCCAGCVENHSLYTVVLLHGHAVNEDVSAEYSLEGFNDIQKALETKGFLNAGTITLFTEPGGTEGWSLIPVPLVFRASYYFDIFQEPDNYVVVQTKSENIDTYAIRLKELIDTIRVKTGREKVKIVAFSMGGLVARRYIQVFGIEHVDRLIMIGTPNQGIVGEIASLCPILGESLECRDMNAESLFINKLNSGNLPDIPIHNIVGTGCEMTNGPGDGAVLTEKALLPGADNYIINGTCQSKLNPLHLQLRDIELYPQVYETLVNALKT